MSVAYQIRPTIEKRQEITELLNNYWGNDIWDISDTFFDNLRPVRLSSTVKVIDFSPFSSSIRDEVKYMYAYRLQERKIRLITIIAYRTPLNRLAEFLNIYYPEITSIVDIPYDKAILQWRSYLTNKNKNINNPNKQHDTALNQLYSYFINLYDTRDEYEKDVWDFRNIVGAKITNSDTQYYLDFNDIPLAFRELSKRYLKYRVTNKSYQQCFFDLRTLRLFLNYIHKVEPLWKNLIHLKRNHMEQYLEWFNTYTQGWKKQHIDYMINLRSFLDYIQRAQYPEAPELPGVLLIFKEDIPQLPYKTEEDIKYIPEGVLQQLEDNLEHLTPSEYIPIVILLRASGWRLSDILNLRYDKCLDRTSQGWYLCGDIPKTHVLNHHIPITDEVYTVVKALVDEIKEKSTNDSNPNKLLFVRLDGRRKGRCPHRESIQHALNRLAIKQNIVDDQGNIFHFGNHAFRHTKGVELINNGMNILHVQKWMAHASPEMTLRYAKVLDTTMRKSWEEATRQGLFKIDEAGKIKKVDISDIQNEDIIEWEYIRSNLDAVRMPLGYCMKPRKQECHTQLNPCLTCRNLCTTPDFIPQYELEIQETKTLIERGKAQNRTVWVEKNQTLLERYEEILSVLKDGKTHHTAGKNGREYVGEERSNVK